MNLIVPRSRLAKANKPKPKYPLSAVEETIADRFQEAVEGLATNATSSALAQALTAGNIGAAVQAFDWGSFGQTLSTTRLSMLTQLNTAGRAEARALGSSIGNYAFDVVDPRAVTWSATRAGQLVVDVSDAVRADIRRTITSGIADNLNPQQVVGQLERQVGLFPRWAQAVESQYERNLSAFQANGMSWRESQSKAMEMAEKYRDRLIRARAENIARTETVTASNQGRYISWLQAADNGLVNLDNSMKEWIAEGNACPICLSVDGEENMVPVLGEWTLSTGESVEMPPGHPSCRCSAVLIPGELPPPQFESPTDGIESGELTDE